MPDTEEQTEVEITPQSIDYQALESDKGYIGRKGYAFNTKDGTEWLLPHQSIGDAKWRENADRIYTASHGLEAIDFFEVLALARSPLQENYQLTDDQARQVLLNADFRSLWIAVVASWTHTGKGSMPAGTRKWSAWARGSLIANGLKPESVPAEDLPFVLYILEHTGKTMAHQEFCEAPEARGAIDAFRGMAVGMQLQKEEKEQLEARVRAAAEANGHV